MKWARIENNVVIETTTIDPAGRFHESIIWESVPDYLTENSYRDEDGEWVIVQPAVIEPGEPVPASIAPVSPVEFKLLFTSAERVGIRAARATDPVIDDFFDIVDDPRLTEVNLNLASTVGAVNYLATKDLIEQDRVDEILMGRPA